MGGFLGGLMFGCLIRLAFIWCLIIIHQGATGIIIVTVTVSVVGGAIDNDNIHVLAAQWYIYPEYSPTNNPTTPNTPNPAAQPQIIIYLAAAVRVVVLKAANLQTVYSIISHVDTVSYPIQMEIS